jgi:hypothetical protein
MRVMVIVKSNPETESGVMDPEQAKMFEEMTAYNEQLVKAGIMLAGEGLLPSAKGKRVVFSGSKRSVLDGPFAETKELIAGFWIWKVKTFEEAVEWAKKCPNPTGAESVLELRQVAEMDDFGDAISPEVRAREEKLAAELAKQSSRSAPERH